MELAGRITLIGIQLMGLVISALLVGVTFSNPDQVEERLRLFAIAEVERAADAVWSDRTVGQGEGSRSERLMALSDQHSKVLGQLETVFADDANITLDHEWFFGIAEFRNPYSYIILGSGDFDGFFEGRYARHYDLSGRILKGVMADNLTIVPAAYAADGQRIQLFLNGISQ